MPVYYYWCVFTDESQTAIASLTAKGIPPIPDNAVLLPEDDPRVQYVLRPPEGRHVQRISVTSLDDLHCIADLFDTGTPKPVYRGQSDYSWELKAAIEREVPEFVYRECGLETYEYRILTESHRRLHHFIDKLPDENDHLSWLALLRHHGVPTRLLDVTKSLFIACYFALRDAKPGRDASIWIFNRQKIDSRFMDWSRNVDDKAVRQSPFTVASYGEPYYGPFPKNFSNKLKPVTLSSLRHPDFPWLDMAATLDAAMRGYIEKPGVAVVEPFWASRRMDMQQGAFLIPFNIRMEFEKNLFSFLDISHEEQEERNVPIETKELRRLWAYAPVIKLRIPSHLHDILRTRLDAMNIRDLTLFPDVEGALAHIAALMPIDRR